MKDIYEPDVFEELVQSCNPFGCIANTTIIIEEHVHFDMTCDRYHCKQKCPKGLHDIILICK